MRETVVEETILAAEYGTVFLRGGFGGAPLTLGLSRSPDPEGLPEVCITLTERQRDTLAYELRIIASAEGGANG